MPPTVLMSDSRNVVKRAIESSAVLLARGGVIDEQRGRRVADLAWPRVVTGLTRTSQRTFDFAMVGLAVGPAAIAGMGFAFAYFTVAMGLGFSLAGGAMTLMSQHFGAEDMDGLDLSIKQTLWVELVLGVVLMVVYVTFSERLMTVLGASPDAAVHGSVYLEVIAISLLFEMPNKVGSRALVSADDAWTPMVIRATAAVINIVLNAVLIFGLGLGVFGAALGTLVATAAVTVAFGVGLLRGRLPGIGPLPFTLRASRPFFDLDLTKQLLEIAAPLMGKRLIGRGSRFAMLAIVAQFGVLVVAAYSVSRRARGLLNAPAWGFGTAARSLVGQELGSGEEGTAGAYGWDILRFALVVYVVLVTGAFLLAPWIAPLFTDDPQTIERTVPFIRVAAVSLFGLGIDSASSGTISAAGDTRWPLYARLVGLYLFMIPVAYLGTVTQLGILAVYAALVLETMVPAAITFWRFQGGAWKVVSRQYRPSGTD